MRNKISFDHFPRSNKEKFKNSRLERLCLLFFRPAGHLPVGETRACGDNDDGDDHVSCGGAIQREKCYQGGSVYVYMHISFMMNKYSLVDYRYGPLLYERFR